jgi:hypothetical protein
VVVPDADFIEKEQRVGEGDEEEERLRLSRANEERHRPGDAEGQSQGIQVPAHPQESFGIVRCGAGTVPVRPHEVGVEGGEEESEGRANTDSEREEDIEETRGELSRHPVEREEENEGGGSDRREVLAQEPPVVSSEDARDVGPREDAVVDRGVSGQEAEGREKRDLGNAELSPHPLPAEVERDRRREQHRLDPREERRAEGEPGEHSGERRALLLHAGEEQERSREKELHDDLGAGKSREPDLDLKHREERRCEGGYLEAEEPPEGEKKARDRHEREERRRVEPGFGLVQSGGGSDPDRVQMKAVGDHSRGLRGLEATSLIAKVVPGRKLLVGKKERPRLPRKAGDDGIVVDEPPVPGEVKAGVDVHPGVAAPEDVLEGRKVDDDRERDESGGDENFGPRCGSRAERQALPNGHNRDGGARGNDHRGAKRREEADLREEERHPPRDEKASGNREIDLLEQAQPGLAFASERRIQRQAGYEKNRESGEGSGEGRHVGTPS